MNRLFLILLQKRHLVYISCAIIFTIATLAVSFQPYFHEIYPKSQPLIIMALTVVFGLSYTAFIKRFAPHKALH